MGTKNQYTDISSASETSLPDLGLSAYDDILNDLIYSNGRAEKPSEFSQLQEKKDRRGVGTGSEGRSAMTGKPTIAANTKFKAYSNETKTKLRCSVNKKTDIRKVTSCLNLNKCQCRKTRKQRSFTDLRHNCGQSGCQDDGLSPGASTSRKMSYTALSRTYWYVINNKEIEQCRFRTCKGWHRRLLQDKVMLYRHIIEYTEILACTSRGVSGWYIADMEGRRAESVSRLKRYYMSYSEVCSQLDSGPPNKQDRRSCYGEVRSNFPLRRELTPRSDHETNDKIVNVVSNCPLSTVDRLTSGQYVSSSKVKPAASSIEIDSRRHQPYGHSVPAGANTRIQRADARRLAKKKDSSISSVQLQDLKQHSNGNEHKPGDKCRRLPSNTIRPDSVSKRSLNKQEATDQRESTISLHRDSSSSIHQDQSSSGQKEHPAEKDSTLNVSHSRQRHHEPPAESHQYFRSRATVYTYDNNGQKFSQTYYQEHAAEDEGAHLQDRDHHRERASGFDDSRRRSMSRSRRMDDRDTERHCTQRHVREDNTDRRPRSHESRQKSQDHEVGVFTSMARRTESERSRENSRELDRNTFPQTRLGTPGDLQVGKASEESKDSLDNRKQVQPTTGTVAVREREASCTKFSTEDHQTGPHGESLSTSDHSCNSLQQACVPGPRGMSKKAVIRQSVSSALALLEQAAAGFDENLHELSCPGAAGGESGEHTPRNPHVGLTSPQSGEHILQPFRRDLCARDSDGSNQITSSSDKAVRDFDVAKQNVSSTDNGRIGCDEQRHNLSLPNQNGKFSDRQNQQRHSRPSVTADKSQMRGRDLHGCSSSLKGSNKDCDKGVKQECVNSSRFSGGSASIQGRGSVSGRKHYLSHDVNPIEPVNKRQKTLSTGQFNLTRLQRCAYSGITDANKAMQPLLPPVELRPTHGDPFLKSTSSLAQAVEQERTFNYYNNIGAARYANNTPEYRLLFSGKIANNTSTYPDDMTFEMAHSFLPVFRTPR